MLVQAGLCVDVVSVGGTHHGARLTYLDAATEIRPGTYVYNDRNTLLAGSCTLEDCAASILVTVISTHATWAVIDAGSKTFSSDPSPFGGFGDVKEHPDLRFERMSEEHGILSWPVGNAPLRVGDRLEVIPNHICPVVNLHDAAYGLRAGQIERILPTDARGQSR